MLDSTKTSKRQYNQVTSRLFVYCFPSNWGNCSGCEVIVDNPTFESDTLTMPSLLSQVHLKHRLEDQHPSILCKSESPFSIGRDGAAMWRGWGGGVWQSGNAARRARNQPAQVPPSTVLPRRPTSARTPRRADSKPLRLGKSTHILTEPAGRRWNKLVLFAGNDLYVA